MSVVSPIIRKLLDLFKLGSTKEMEKEAEERIIISDYSTMPRFYTINGIRYDIDDPREIKSLPIVRSTFLIKGERYGLDSVLRRHSAEAYTKNKDIYNASLDKLDEYQEKGICFKTESEIQHELERAETEKARKTEEENKIKLNYSFSIKDMYQFEDIPFEWSWVMELSYSNGIAWFMLNKNNQYIALSALDFINKVLGHSKVYTGCTADLYICTENIDFDFPVPMHKDSLPCTYVQCVPYTLTGKISKFPVVLHFSEYPTQHVYGNSVSPCYEILGEIYILRTGEIGKADIQINGYKIQLRLRGSNLVVRRIDKRSLAGNILIYKSRTL